MKSTDVTRRSHWILRVMEWDDPKARYPNIWQEGMPRHVLAMERLAGRLRLGDLVAIFHPASQKYPIRSERYLGLCRVAGLRGAEGKALAWIDLAVAHRFEKPLRLAEAPRRVFLCCDPGWQGPEVTLFRAVYDAAMAEGWEPGPDETFVVDDEAGQMIGEPRVQAPAAGETVTVAPAAPAEDEDEPAQRAAAPVAAVEPVTTTSAKAAVPDVPESARLFAGAHYSGDMRDPRERTWLALLAQVGDRLSVVRLDATGRAGLESRLRDPDSRLMRSEAIGLAFPFGLPAPFAEKLLGGQFPDEGWWSLIKHVEHLSRPRFLEAVHEFLDEHGEVKRFTDETAGTDSPLHRDHRDLTPRTYHGMRMIGADRSRYAVRPFESAKAQLLLEVSPDAFLRRHGLTGGRRPDVLDRLAALDSWPVDVAPEFRKRCGANAAALHAVLASRCSAAAVLDGESELTPDELDPGQAGRIRHEGWIYGLRA